MKKVSKKVIFAIALLIILMLLSSFIVFRFVVSKSISNDLANDFHKRIKNEHIKIEKLSKEIDKNPNYYILYQERANAKLKKQEIFQDFINIFMPYNEYPIVNDADIKADLIKTQELNPNIDINFDLGFIEYKNKKYNEAIKLFNEYIKTNQNSPNLYFAHYYRGLCKYKIEDVSNAISDFNTVIKLNPQFSKSYTSLGNVYNAYEIDNVVDNQIAFNYYNKAISLNNNDIENHLRKIYELALSGNSNINAVMTEFDKAMNTNYGKYCSLLYWTMGISRSIDNEQRMKMAHSHYKSAKILSRAIKTCKYCTIPNDYYEDIKDIQWDSYFLLINNSVDMGEIGKAKKYYKQCKLFAHINSYGDLYCDSLLDEEIR